MSISIGRGICTGCGACARVCPGNLLAVGGDGIAYSRSPKDCWGCTACLKACPVQAISYFLGADMGGRGTLLHVESGATCNVWIFERPDGSTVRMETLREQANRY